MDKLKVVITDYYYESLQHEKNELAKINADIFDYHCNNEDEVIEVAKDADAIIVQFAPITRKVIENLDKCKLIIRYAIGVDNIDIEAATEHNIYVANVPDYGIDEVSNHAILLLLASARKLPISLQSVKEGLWDYKLTKPLYRLAGKRLGLVGFGRIPRLIAKKLQGFSLEIISHDPYVNTEQAKELGVQMVSLDELVETSDFISIHSPLTESTKHLFNISTFEKMKRTAFIINTARGPIIKEEDLIEALRKRYIAGAALDVTEKEPIDINNPLLKMDNVILTPHSAWYTEEAIETLQKMVGEEVVRVLSGNKPKNLVNKSLETQN